MGAQAHFPVHEFLNNFKQFAKYHSNNIKHYYFSTNIHRQGLSSLNYGNCI